MSQDTQRHIIQRQVIEVTTPGGRLAARSVQDEISRIHLRRIIPLLDRHLSRVSGPDRIIRIDTLELDLGTLDTSCLEEDFTARMDAVLSRELDNHIRQQEREAPEESILERSHLELLAFFLVTGCVPWWADITRPGLLGKALDSLVADSPKALKRVLKSLVIRQKVRTRLVRHFTFEQLRRVIILLNPCLETDLGGDVRVTEKKKSTPGVPDLSSSEPLKTLWAAFRSVPCLKTVAEDRIERSFWSSLFEASCSAGNNPAVLVKAVIDRMAQRLGTPSLKDDLVRMARKLNGNSQSLLRVLLAKDRFRPDSQHGSEPRARDDEGTPESGMSKEGLKSVHRDKTGTNEPAQAHAFEAKGLEKDGFSDQGTIHSGVEGFLDKSPRFPLLRAEHVSIPTWGNEEGQSPMDLGFSQADSVPVTNAGLVILWPFLASFFTRARLLDEHRCFRDLSTRHRGTVLLQAVAAKEPEPPEYLLPLNKILCGLDAKTVVEPGPPVTYDESEECEAFLKAVIARAQILRDMSPDGFRGSFLLRKGMLSRRDGKPLLRVARETYDIVFDRFPWTWEWVRLPWMDAPLRVEWEVNHE